MQQCHCSIEGKTLLATDSQAALFHSKPLPLLHQVPLEAVDPSRQSLLYTQGDQAAVTPIYDYDFSILYGAAQQSSWREILWCAAAVLPAARFCMSQLASSANCNSSNPNSASERKCRFSCDHVTYSSINDT